MQKKFLRGTRQYQVGTTSLLVLKYYIIERSISSSEYYYGVEINEEKISGGIEHTIKYNSLQLSESKEWVEELIDRFIGNGVTPDTMEYIIDDIMGIPC
ncbi:MAG TPA: hypothetical protein GX707_18275 [Epulopiscium sp.]|nr:hypothetical protein [Candidatus Epulonipiscium sp.]